MHAMKSKGFNPRRSFCILKINRQPNSAVYNSLFHLMLCIYIDVKIIPKELLCDAFECSCL